MIGANDVTSRTRPAGVRAAPRRRRPPADRGRLRGRRRHLPRPRHDPADRPAAAHASPAGGAAQLAAAQTVAVVEAGGRTVSLGSVLGPAFASDRSMFSVDEFHPSAAGYAQAAAVLLPSVRRRRRRLAGRRRPRRAARSAAAPCARSPRPPRGRPSRTGTEVQPAEVRGSDTGPRGPWALLRRRRPAGPPDAGAGGGVGGGHRRRLTRRPSAAWPALPRSSFGGDPTSADRPRTRLIVEDPMPEAVIVATARSPSAARSRAR